MSEKFGVAVRTQCEEVFLGPTRGAQSAESRCPDNLLFVFFGFYLDAPVGFQGGQDGLVVLLAEMKYRADLPLPVSASQVRLLEAVDRNYLKGLL